MLRLSGSFLRYRHLSHYEIHWADHCSWIQQSAYNRDFRIQSGNLNGKVLHIPSLTQFFYQGFYRYRLTGDLLWKRKGSQTTQQHLRSPNYTSVNTDGQVWCLRVLGFFVVTLGFVLIWFFLTLKETWGRKISKEVWKNKISNTYT